MKTERNILIAFILNLSFSIIETIGSFIIGSVAIASDAIHDLGDSLSIGISYILEKKSKKEPDNNHTYGYIKYSLIGGIITTIILLVGSIIVIIESIKRIFNPVTINHNSMIAFAILGVIINLIASHITKEGDSLNQKAVNLHMLEDVLGWIAVLIGAIIIKITNLTIIDPLLSILVATFILVNVIHNLKKYIDLFLEKTPDNIDIEDLKKELLKIENIKDIHHIHIRSIDGFNNIATLHVKVEKYNTATKKGIKELLNEHGISHSTIELELPNEECLENSCSIKKNKTHHHHHHH